MNAAGGRPSSGLWERIARVLFALFPPSYRERHAAARQALTEQLLESESDPGRRSRLARGVAFDALRTLPLAWLRGSVSTVGDDDGDFGRKTLRDRIPSFSLLDWKLGFRMLSKDPGLSLIGGFALACAIGVGGGLFHVAQQFWFSDMGLEEGRQIVSLERLDPTSGNAVPIPVEEFIAWRDELTQIVELSAGGLVGRTLVVRAGESGAMTEDPLMVAAVTASSFPLTRVHPLRGRVLTEADEGPGAPSVIVVGYETWQSHLGADPNIIGRELQLEEQRVTVVGVMPQGFVFLGADAWSPLNLSEAGPDALVPPPFGRLAPSASFASAQAELQIVGAQTAAERIRRVGQLGTPRAGDSPQALSEARIRRFATFPAPTTTNLLTVFSAALVFILCMTAVCANVATLQFARTAKRESEIVVRNALGASRGRIAGQLFVEALVLSLVSAAVGLAGAQLLIRQLRGPLGDILPMPFWWSHTFEIETILAVGGLAVLGAAMVAVLPAIKATGKGMNDALKSRAVGGTNPRLGGVWSVIIVFQVAITVMCLPSGVSFAHEVWRYHAARESFPGERYLSFTLSAPPQRRVALDDPERARHRAVVYEELARRLAMEPGFQGITYGSGLAGMQARYGRLGIESTEARDSLQRYTVGVRVQDVDVHYLETFELPVVVGRGFEAGDVVASNHPVLINESFARFLGGSPLGRRFRFGSREPEPGPWLEVVGVVRSVGTDANSRRRKEGMETEDMMVYRPSSAALPPTRTRTSASMSLWVAVKTANPEAFAPRLRAIAEQLGPEVRLGRVGPLDVELRQQNAEGYFWASASVGGVLLCIFLSAGGLSAVMDVAVANRTREVGIRLALGATRKRVLAALFGRAAVQLGIGTVVGSVLFAAMRTLLAFDGGQGFAEVKGNVPGPLLFIAVVMLIVGLAACALPAQHALRIHPLDAIRE